MTNTYDAAVAELREAHVFRLARMAECADPDNGTRGEWSPGADWLDTVRLAAIEHAEWLRQEGMLNDNARDDAHEVADSAVPVYTFNRWQVFTDLAAWQEDDIDELAGESADMAERAGVALYLIAERLTLAIWDELTAAAEADDEV